MDPQFLELLAHPIQHSALHVAGNRLVAPQGNQSFPIIDNIPSFLGEFNMTPADRRTAWLYDRFAFAYDATLSLGHRLRLASEQRVRQDYIQHLSIAKNARILEIGAGTGANRSFLPNSALYVGLDSSMNMLRRAQSFSRRESLPAHLLHADAHSLPIKSRSFDFVLSMGLLQHLSNPRQAFSEMQRVVRQDGLIIVLDEVSRLPVPANTVSRNKPQALANSLFASSSNPAIKAIPHTDYISFEFSTPHS